MAVDALASWHALQPRLQPSVAHLVLCRASLEATVTARWLIDPNVTLDQRRRRGLWLQIDDFQSQSGFERRAGAPLTAAPKLAAIRSEAASLRVRPSGLNRTERMEQYAVIRSPDAKFRGAAMYGLLSGFTHAMEWSVIASERTNEREAPGIPGSESLS